MENQQPKPMPFALAQAAKLRTAIELLENDCSEDVDFDDLAITANALQTLHFRVQELEAMLDAVGAGGVSAQRVTQSQPLKASTDWLIDGGLLYRLNDEGTNCDEINVSMAHGLRTEAARIKRAEEILNMLTIKKTTDHIEQPIEMAAAQVVLPEPEAHLFQHEDTGQTMFVEAQQVEWGFEANNPRLQKISGVYTEEQVRELLDKAACTKSQTTAQEPFGYFKAEPFGWRDCAETDEGAIALYEAPQPQADARDAELVAAVVYASTEAMNSSMESPSFDGNIILESHQAASLSLALDELEQHRAAIAKATGRVDSGDGEKKGKQ